MVVFANQVKDWYWVVGGNGPHITHAGAPYTGDESRVYSSAKLSYVPSDDSNYVEWKKRVGSLIGIPDPTTRIDTEDNLTDVLYQYGIAAKFEAPK